LSWKPTRLELFRGATFPGLETATVALAAAGLCLVGAAFVALLPVAWLAGPGSGLRFVPQIALGLLSIGGSAALAGLAVSGDAGPHRLAHRVRVAATVPVLVALVAVAALLLGGLGPVGHGTGTMRSLLAASLLMAVMLPAAAWLLQSGVAREGIGKTLSHRREMIVLGMIIVAFVVVVMLGILQRLPFGWDESVYALTTRHWVQGTPDTGWGIHRPPVLSIIGILPMLASDSEAGFRLIGLVFGSGAVAAVWLLGRRLGGSGAGLLAAAVLASAASIQIDAGQFLNDVPATGLLLLFMASLWRIMERERVEWTLVWLAPIAALAFYVRYGSSISILAIVVAAFLIWPRRLIGAWPKVVVGAGVLLLLLLPHLVFATLNTGTPWGIALLASGGAQGAYPGEALLTYLSWLPDELVGPLGAAAAIGGLAATVFALVRCARVRGWDRFGRATAFLVVPAAIQIVILGMTILPQARYIFFPMACLMTAGCIAAARLYGRLGRYRAGLARVASACLVAYFAATAATLPARTAGHAAELEWIERGGRYIAAHSAGTCSILASNVPQFTWYSGCATYNFAGGKRANRDRLLSGDAWLVVRADGLFQPSGAVLHDYLARVERSSSVALQDGDGHLAATLYRFAP
jgi:4-amino-4-deoxy-L-arabinose transferase-like glycosyltransferase